MKKNTIAIFFTVIFMALIITPSVIIALDDSFDVSIFYSVSDEEEKGANKNLEIAFSKIKHSQFDFISDDGKIYFGYFYKVYPKPHLNIIFPPPEVNII